MIADAGIGRVFCLLAAISLIAGTTEVVGQPVPITAVCILPDGQLLTGSDAGLRLHDAETLKPIQQIESELEKISAIKLSPDGTKFAISGGVPADLGGVEVFSLNHFKPLNQFQPFDDIATDFVWNSNDCIVACSMTGNCCEMRLDLEKKAAFNVHSKGILSLEILNSGKYVSTGLDHTIKVWDIDRKNKRSFNNHIDVVNQLALRPSPANENAMLVSVSDDATVRFWQPEIGRMVRFARLSSIPTCVVWNHDGTRVAVGTRSGKLFFVDPTTANIVQSIEATGWINCLALAPDKGSVLIGGESGLQRVNYTAR